MPSRKSSKVLAGCPNCRLHITEETKGSRKDKWFECPRCGEVFEAHSQKQKPQRASELTWEDEEPLLTSLRY